MTMHAPAHQALQQSFAEYNGHYMYNQYNAYTGRVLLVHIVIQVSLYALLYTYVYNAPFLCLATVLQASAAIENFLLLVQAQPACQMEKQPCVTHLLIWKGGPKDASTAPSLLPKATTKASKLWAFCISDPSVI